jgi:phosphoribosylamine--glycine ligase
MQRNELTLFEDPICMNVLIIGSGGREHALAWKLKQSPRADRVFVAPGNAGTEMDAENVRIPATDFAKLIAFIKQNHVGLTVVGPEAPLAAGIVDVLARDNVPVFGPTKQAAELEASKVFCKNLLRQADVPTADYQVFRSADSARRFINDRYPSDAEDVPVVIKADGLAAGKGVIVCRRREQAISAIDRITNTREFGDAGNRLVIEERLDGDEASVMAITDGQTIVTLPPAQDHKAAFDEDKGPNTGGMGAYCPTGLISPAMLRMIEEQVLVPTVHAMKRSRRPFRGVLYAGIIVTNQGPKVLEFNVRFGDPECQPLLMRLKTDLLDVLQATVEGCLEQLPTLEWDPRSAVCVVMASEGYPGNYDRGKRIRGLEDAQKLEDVKVFHAGTVLRDGEILTDGGRVLAVTALGSSISAAKLQAYKAVRCIRWDGAWCRKDISDKALKYMYTAPG